MGPSNVDPFVNGMKSCLNYLPCGDRNDEQSFAVCTAIGIVIREIVNTRNLILNYWRK